MSTQLLILSLALGGSKIPISRRELTARALEAPMIEISTGMFHACAIRANNHAECWGRNHYGQTSVSPDVEYKHISAGHSHSCAIRKDNSLAECWGSNGFGESTVAHAHPYSRISAGRWHTCAVREDNAHAECWGNTAWATSLEGSFSAATLWKTRK